MAFDKSKQTFRGWDVVQLLTYLLSLFACPHSPVLAAEPAHRLIVGWDDAVIVCGPATVAGMDSPRAIEQMVRRWKARGYLLARR